MVKFTNILTKILIFIVSLLCIVYCILFSFQKSITKQFISSLLENTETSELLVNYSSNGSKLVTIKDYISKSLDVFGKQGNTISKDIIDNYIESLTDAILSDIIFKYLNNEELVINTNYEEMGELSKFIPSNQQKKLDIVIENINNEINKYMNTIFEEKQELKYIKILNNFDTQYILILIICLIIITFAISKNRMKTLKDFICMLSILILFLLIFNISYTLFFHEMLFKMEKYGNSLQIFFNDFKTSLLVIWKNMVIILVIISIIYILIKHFSKKMST